MSWTCEEWNKVQLRGDGQALACCHLPFHHFPLATAFDDKVAMNRRIRAGDFGPCAGCKHLREVDGPGDPVEPVAIDIVTNSFCPLRCRYCYYTIPNGMQDILGLNPTKVSVAQHGYNATDIPTFIRTFAAQSGSRLRMVSLSGGDTAYHPQFQEIVNTINEVGCEAVYLTSAVLPREQEDFVRAAVRDNRLTVSWSADAGLAETWAKVKARPLSLYEKAAAFISSLLSNNPHNRVVLKFIVMESNRTEVPQWLHTWAGRGARRFMITALFGSPNEQESRPELAVEAEIVREAQRVAAERGVRLEVVMLPH